MDKDAQLLANRIALLKQEEMKTWKKIDETKKRTKDIFDLKHQNYEKQRDVTFLFLTFTELKQIDVTRELAAKCSEE